MRNRKVWLYFILTYALSWSIWISIALSKVNVQLLQWKILMMFGGLAPSLFGIIFIIKEKTYTRKEIIKYGFSFININGRNVLLLFLSILIPFIGSIFLDSLMFNNKVDVNDLVMLFRTPRSLFLFIIISIYSGPITEEFGWRGFAAKQFLVHKNVIKTGIIIGIVWSLWHLPLFFIPGQYNISNYYLFIINRLFKEVSLSIIITYFFYKTNYSILSAMIIHGLSNACVNLFFPVSMSRNIIHTILLITVVCFIIVIDKNVISGKSVPQETSSSAAD